MVMVAAAAGWSLLAGPSRLRAQEAAPAHAPDSAPSHAPHNAPAHTPYADQQHTAVRGLSEQEIDDLRNGRGMGLARPAEINGYPGPRHVLDLAAELQLTDAQRTAVEALFTQMQAEAAPLGEQFLARYAHLEHSFRTGHATAGTVAQMTAGLGQIEGQLRATHLKYHLLTRPILTDDQNTEYARLRGYTVDGGIDGAPQHGAGHGRGH